MEAVRVSLNLIDPSLVPLVRPCEVTASGEHGPFPGRCFTFARAFVESSPPSQNVCYVEGVVCIHHVLPIGHAWVKNEGGHYIDGSAVDLSFPRLGIEIPADVFVRHMRSPAFSAEYERHDLFPFVRAYMARVSVNAGDLSRELTIHPQVSRELNPHDAGLAPDDHLPGSPLAAVPIDVQLPERAVVHRDSGQ